MSPTNPAGGRVGNLDELNSPAAGQMLDIDHVYGRIQVRLQ